MQVVYFLTALLALAYSGLRGHAPFVLPPQRPHCAAGTFSPAAMQAMADKEAAEADHRAHYSVHQGVVEIGIHNVTKPAYQPLESLVIALDRYPNATRFHVAWGCYYGRHSSGTEATYRRRAHRLDERCVGWASPWGSFRGRTVFLGVTDLALRRDARAHRHSRRTLPFDEDLDVVFDDLPRYGCQRKRADRWHSGP